MRALGCALLASACVPAALPPGDDGPFYSGSPVITELSFDCELAEAEWSLEVHTEGWTGGGRLYLTRDGSLVEDHRVYSEEAAGDGSWDRLSLELDVEADWTEASSGSSTAFRCADADALSVLFVVYGPKGNNQADCRIWGAEPELWATLEGVPACETSWEPDTGG